MKEESINIQMMEKALSLAKRGQGKTSPNPCVGAIVVFRGKIVGRGWHRKAGEAHAEIEALEQAKKRLGSLLRKAVLYVTLEPCCTWGKTPPCIDTILAEGIQKIVIGTIDPNPKHAGRGIRLLKKEGVQVKVGILEKKCRQLNQNWNHWIVHRKPWVIAKCAMTLDGKIATKTGESRWITSQLSRQKVHELRNQVDAILVGIHTVLKDNPRLTVRLKREKSSKRPIRIILDSLARTPPQARLFKEKGKVWIFVSKKAPARRIQVLEKRGAKILEVSQKGGFLDLEEILKWLGKEQVMSLLVEGGGGVLGSFYELRQVQESLFFIAPRILGGKENIKAVGGKGFWKWKESLKLESVRVTKVGNDLMVRGNISR